MDELFSSEILQTMMVRNFLGLFVSECLEMMSSFCALVSYSMMYG